MLMAGYDSLRVDLGSRSYSILIGSGLLSSAGQHIAGLLPKQRLFILTDETVAGLHLSTLQNSLTQSGFSFETIIVAPGEQSKSFAVLEEVVSRILACKPERQSTLIALGGGVIGDLTGFAASILLRGINFIQIPTTLLAQVDSSVGGKTGINTANGKNLVGSFYQPLLVIADSDVLATLPDRDYLSGYAEVIKYGLIKDPEFFAWAVAHESALKSRDLAALHYAVNVSCQHKAAIVAADEREGGVRALLNLGHTFGHALEAETNFSDELLHGEAVAIGMVMAMQMSVQLGLCSAQSLEQVTGHLQRMGLPVSPYDIRPAWDNARLIEHMYGDKKIENGKLVFILLKAIGRAFIQKDVKEEAVYNLLNNMKSL
jgi:3-dehydroquinate synthase